MFRDCRFTGIVEALFFPCLAMTKNSQKQSKPRTLDQFLVKMPSTASSPAPIPPPSPPPPPSRSSQSATPDVVGDLSDFQHMNSYPNDDFAEAFRELLETGGKEVVEEADDFRSEGDLSDGTELPDDVSVDDIFERRKLDVDFLLDEMGSGEGSRGSGGDQTNARPHESVVVQSADKANNGTIEDVRSEFPKAVVLNDRQIADAFYVWQEQEDRSRLQTGETYARTDIDASAHVGSAPYQAPKPKRVIPCVPPDSLVQNQTDHDRAVLEEAITNARDKKHKDILRTFLMVSGGKGYCIACITTDCTADVKNSGLRGWNSDGSKFSDSSTLRSNFFDHVKSKCHTSALTLLRQRAEDAYRAAVVNGGGSKSLAMDARVKVVHFINTKNLSASLAPDLLVLLTGGAHDGLFMSERRFRDLGVAMTEKSRSEFIEALTKSTGPICVSLDGSTSQGDLKMVVLSIRLILDGYRIDTYLDIVDVPGEDADTIVNAVVTTLEKFGISKEQLKKRLVCITTDGASVMQGSNIGVTTQLNRDFGPLVIIHCFAHRLELVFKVGRDIDPGVRKLIKAVNGLYVLYRRSGPLKKRLKQIAQELGISYKGLSQVIEVRWLPSTYRALLKVWYMHAAITKHFEELVSSGAAKKSKAAFEALLKYVGCAEFVEELGFLLGVLSPLMKLSLRLQTRMLSAGEAQEEVVKVYGALRVRLTEVQRSWKSSAEDRAAGEGAQQTTGGTEQVSAKSNGDGSEAGAGVVAEEELQAAEKAEQAEPYFSTPKLDGVLLNMTASAIVGRFKYTRIGKFPRIHRHTFLETLVKSFAQKFMTKELMGTFMPLTHVREEKIPDDASKHRDVETSVKKILNSNWLKKDMFERPLTVDVVMSQWGSAVTLRSKNIALDWNSPVLSDLKNFLDLLWCLAPTSAECERLFSLMNRIHTKGRASMRARTLRDRMHLQAIGLPLSLLDVRSYTRHLMKKGFGTRTRQASKPSVAAQSKFSIWRTIQKPKRR